MDFEGKMTREHIGCACPRCGADMLTEADYKVGRRIQFVIGVLTFLRLMKPASRRDVANEDGRVFRYHYHNGKLTTSEKQ